VPEPRQRWRLTVRRDAEAPPLSQRELFAAWEDGIAASGLPVAVGDPAKPKPRLAFGAPLSVGLEAERELVDVVLLERLPAWRVRDALEPNLPTGWSLVDLTDVWLGGPPLAGRVVAADYRVTLAGPATGVAIGEAARAVLAARSLPRERAKGDGTVRYDLRPLVADISVVDPGPPCVARIRTRFHPELGTGRPEEVMLALSDQLGVPIEIERIVRERLVLADEIG
jgi:radical SAM-linked protein